MKRKPPEALPSSVKPADDAQVKSKGKPAPQIQRMTASWEEIRKEPAAVEVLKREATAKDLGGALVKGDNREQVVFVKRVETGERGRLRCNKHDPPFFIVCSNESVD